MPTLDWLNRADAFTTAARVPYRLLEPVSSHGTGADNLLIQGDNLEALKALLPFYRGKVKCIFIDPPYNTKSAFEHYDDNLEHSQWLSMMLPRLKLLRDLLREDGSIWVTIDDNEGHYLKVLMDEVFGRGNFVATAVWEKTTSARNDAQLFSNDQDYVYVYAKSLPSFTLNRLQRTESSNNAYKNPDEDPRGPWREIDYKCAKTADERPNLYYAIRHPITGADVWPRRSRVWAYGQQEHARHLQENLLWWGKTGNYTLPKLKKFYSDASVGLVPRTLWFASDVDQTRTAKKEMKELFPEEPFGTPKPERLLQRVLHLATAPNDLILDSFLGSGTTAAVAHKMGRRWIGIEMGEHAATHCLPRLEKVIAGEPGGISAAVNWQGGGGFRFLRLGAPIFGADGCIHPDVRFATLAAFVWQQETGQTWAAHAARAGTPYLGTHYPIDSSSRPSDAGNVPISLEILRTDLFSAPAPAAEPQPTPPASAPPVGAPRQGTAYYLLFNGILGDKRPASGNVLTQAVLDALLALHGQIHGPAPSPAVPLVVYGEACRLGAARLKLANLTFRHIPYDVKAR
jgi:adenine-specific DNA-methyltransferase